jgi:hypothetical protein
VVDVEALLTGWLSSRLSHRFVTDVPDNLQGALPLGRVLKVGGPADDNDPRFDLPTVSVDCFAADRAAAITFAQAVDDAIRITLPGLTVNGSTVTRTATISGPAWRPWDDSTLRRFGATYRLYVKN